MTKMQVINFTVKMLLFVIQSEIELSERKRCKKHRALPYPVFPLILFNL
jgi:hypothetical protein